MEAALFIMCSVARNLQPTEQEQSSCVPQIVEAVLGIPETFHLAVRHTSIRLIGELAEWLEYNSEKYLEPVLQWLQVGLQDRRLASTAATALQNVCSNCQRHMAPHLQVSNSHLYQLFNPSKMVLHGVRRFGSLPN